MQPHHTSAVNPEHQREQSSSCRRGWQIRSRIIAQQHFDRALRHGWVDRIIDAVRGRSPRLRCLADLNPTPRLGPAQRPMAQAVPLSQIVGSEGRPHDFDRHFAPLHEHIRERWVSLAALRSEGHALPPVELVQIGDHYYVLDGHHRISVAHAFNDRSIEAHVSRWLPGAVVAYGEAALAHG